MAENEVMEENLSYQTIKNIIKGKLNSVAESFVSIGYQLKKVRDGELYKEDGYKNIYEFAKMEYNIEKSNVSRFMNINDKFSENGNSPFLIPEYAGYGSSKLAEMLNMDDEELKLVSGKTTVTEIREIKQTKNEAVQNGVVATSQQTAESLDYTLSKSDFTQVENQDISNLKNIVTELFRDKNKRELVKELSALLHKNLSGNELTQEISELVNPSKHYLFKKGFNMAIFEENEIKYKEFGGSTIEYTYLNLMDAIKDSFDMAAADPWVEYYGEPEPEEKPELKKETKAEAKEIKPEKDKPKKPEPEKTAKQQEKKPEPKVKVTTTEEIKEEEETTSQINIDDYPEYAPESPEIEIVEGDVIQEETMETIQNNSEYPQEDNQVTQEEETKVHAIKIAPKYFEDVLSKIKTFELRKNERDYKVGEILQLNEDHAGSPTGRELKAEITYILEGYTGLSEGYCILGIQVIR